MRHASTSFWFHPLLLAIFPGLSLLAANVDQVPLSQGVRILAGSLLVGVLVYLVARLVQRRWDAAALTASLVVVALMSYGRLYDALKETGLSGETIVRHRYLIPVCAVLVGAGVVWLARRRDAAGLNRILNVASLVAVVFPLAGIGIDQAQALSGAAPPDLGCTLQPVRGQPLPDVYLIVMDAYERDDVLRDFGGYDNAPFLRSLEDKGFYVAYGSLSNYRQTELSLSSMLNMEYIQDYPKLFGARSNRTWDIVQLINHSRMRREFECLGYVTVAFETGHFWTEWDDSDYYLQPDPGGLPAGVGGRISRLEYLFLETTAGRALLDGWTASRSGAAPAALDPIVEYRARILFEFDELARVPRLPAPKLVFVHILVPHPPFIFGPNGEPINEEDFETTYAGQGVPVLELYRDQVIYTNQRLLQALDAILEGSAERPIIVLMGDHGWADRNMEDKLSILNTYLVPPEVEARLDQKITPVNTFRVIFDAAFGGSYGRLPDVSYFSMDTRQYDFTVVPNTWSPASP